MEHRKALIIAFVLVTITLSLTSSDSTVKAQKQIKIVADTGLITLGPNQILRVSAGSLPPALGVESVVLRFRRIRYEPVNTEEGLTSLAAVSQTTSEPITLASGEAATFDVTDGTSSTTLAVRGVVLSNRSEVKVNALIIDSATGRVVSIIDLSGYFAP